jgi:hypothetical protein
MQGYQFIVDNHALAMPWWWFDALVGWLGVMGVLVWLFGWRLVKPMFMVMGLLEGTLAAMLVARAVSPGADVTGWCLGGALLGAIAGFMLWRIGVGLGLAALGALAGLAIGLAINAAPLPAVSDALTQSTDAFRQTLAKAAVEDIKAKVTADKVESGVKISEPLTQAADPLRKTVGDWWAGLATSAKWVLGSCSVGLAGIAFVVGIVFARSVSALVTAFIGTLMMAPGVHRLLDFAPASVTQKVSLSPGAVGVAILVAGVIGALIQWTQLRKSADK